MMPVSFIADSPFVQRVFGRVSRRSSNAGNPKGSGEVRCPIGGLAARPLPYKPFGFPVRRIPAYDRFEFFNFAQTQDLQ